MIKVRVRVGVKLWLLLLHSACFGQCAERDDLAGGPYPSTVVSLHTIWAKVRIRQG